ncbi:MAG: hypothetical protein QM536_02885 [Chitinophagaceae bacterium]|nr:hypothetical protein [Chitinophagaceae bacterium]
MKKYITFLLFFFYQNISAQEIGVSIPHVSFEGTVTKTKFVHKNCAVSEMSIVYTFSLFGGDPVLTASVKWKSGILTKPTCFKNNDIILLTLQSKTGNKEATLKIKPEIPSIGELGKEYSHTFAWNEIFCAYKKGKNIACWSEKEAKEFWNANFFVKTFSIVRVNK